MTVRSHSKNTGEHAVRGLLPLGLAVAIGATMHAQMGSSQPAPAQKPASAPAPQNGKAIPNPAAPPNIPAGVTPPPDYVIGPSDVLSIVYWREKDLSSDVTVRPDGNISLPLLNDIHAAGLTPAQLRDRLTEAARRYVEDPNVTVVVHEINSRKVFVTGEIANPGEYPLMGPTTVLQLIAVAGGLRDYADGKKILIVRPENGKQVTYRFNYKDAAAGKGLRQNIELKPGDTIIVP
jgi:polysaccharide biosynthesis/export protein